VKRLGFLPRAVYRNLKSLLTLPYVQDELRVERMGYRLGEEKQAVTLGMRRTNSNYERFVEGAT